MDPVALFRKRISDTSLSNRYPGILCVLAHLEQAEGLYSRGTSDREDQYFTDAVYRANHAFEGMLREAYGLFTGKDATGLNIATIENRLLKDGVFQTRVMELFKNNRQSWRNPSTHDHTLFFDRVESFLAVQSVSSFVNILYEQMVEKIAHDAIQNTIVGPPPAITTAASTATGRLTNMERVCTFLMNLVDQKASEVSFAIQSEAEIVGLIHAFLEVAVDVNHVMREPQIGNHKTRLRPDISFYFENESYIVDVKHGDYIKSGQVWVETMGKYLIESDIGNAVLVVIGGARPYDYRVVDRTLPDRMLRIGVVASRIAIENSGGE